MASPIPSAGALRALRQSIRAQIPQNPQSTHQVRHATLLRRPKRPYTFTQLITLSDGSSFLHRTTSPAPIYKSTKDIKNTPLWNPSSQKLLNVEEDEAGRLRAFRSKFGRGWDAESTGSTGQGEMDAAQAEEDHLLDLISGSKKKEVVKKAATKVPAADSKAPAAAPPKGKK